MKQIKHSFVKRKSTYQADRQVQLKSPEQIRTLLLVSNTENKPLKKKVEDFFPNASVYHLFNRDIKEDRTVGFYYSVHKSDFNLTGGLKNDKLVNLEEMTLDLLLDLSSDYHLLDYFVNRTAAHLKVGNILTYKPNMYDLLLEFSTSDDQTIDIIYNHLIKLTINASEQV